MVRWLGAVRDGLRLREIRYLLVLLVASAAAYVALSFFLNVWGSGVLGVRAPSVPPGISGIFYNNSSPATQPLGTILQSAQTLSTGEYWLLIYALLAFIPLLSPRALILSVPWIGWTFLTDSSHFTTFGREYAMIAAGPLFIGLAYGLRRVPISRPWPTPLGAGAPAATGPVAARYVAPHLRARLRSVETWWVTALALVVVVNALLMPINPVLPDLGVAPGAPFESEYFNHSLEISPGYTWVENLVSTVPHEATIVAPSAIFPLLANYPHAYVLARPHQMDLSALPFNASSGPQYVLVPLSSLATTNDEGVLGTNLSRNVSNPLLYGMRGYVGSTTLGPILLYEQDYSLPAELFGPAIPLTAATYLPGAGLAPGPKGVQVANSSAPFGKVIKSVGGSNRTGLVGNGPNALLAPGNYTLIVDVVVTGPGLTLHPDQAALRVVVEGFGGTPLDQSLPASGFVSGVWTNLSFNLSLADPLPKMNVEVFLESGQLSLAIGAASIEPEGS